MLAITVKPLMDRPSDYLFLASTGAKIMDVILFLISSRIITPYQLTTMLQFGFPGREKREVKIKNFHNKIFHNFIKQHIPVVTYSDMHKVINYFTFKL